MGKKEETKDHYVYCEYQDVEYGRKLLAVASKQPTNTPYWEEVKVRTEMPMDNTIYILCVEFTGGGNTFNPPESGCLDFEGAYNSIEAAKEIGQQIKDREYTRGHFDFLDYFTTSIDDVYIKREILNCGSVTKV